MYTIIYFSILKILSSNIIEFFTSEQTKLLTTTLCDFVRVISLKNNDNSVIDEITSQKIEKQNQRIILKLLSKKSR